MLLIIILILIIIINLMNVYFRKEKIIENNTGYDTSNTIKDCIVNWDEDYGPCSASCGGGTQELKFEVLQELRNGLWHGKSVDAIQCPPTEKRPCNEQPCQIDCEGQWGPWSLCQKDDGTPAKCGGGKRSRSYNITQPAVDGYIDGVLIPGTACLHKHDDIQEEDCNVKPCAVDCVGAWGDELSDCDKQTGTQFKTYKITTPAKDGYIYNTDGVEKPDPAVQCGAAHNEKQYTDCPVDCELTGWEWVRHNWELGSDVYERAIRIEPKNGGLKCDESLLKWEDKPVDCEGYWEDNGECEDYWKKQKYTIIGKGANGTGKECPHNAGDVRTLRPGIHTCNPTTTTWCSHDSWLGCLWTSSRTTYSPNGL